MEVYESVRDIEKTLLSEVKEENYECETTLRTLVAIQQLRAIVARKFKID